MGPGDPELMTFKAARAIRPLQRSAGRCEAVWVRRGNSSPSGPPNLRFQAETSKRRRARPIQRQGYVRIP